MKLLYQISRWIMSLLFIFSGVSKAINPFGLSIQITEYLNAMGLGVLKPLSTIGSIAMPSLEILLGTMLALNLSRRIASWGVMLSMSFFTLLTLWIAVYNPVSDCGCFGDILKLTNWETFIKNLILLPFAVVVFINRNYGKSSNRLLYVIALPISFSLALYSHYHLPLIDGTPFKIGTNIVQAMSIPEDAPQAQTKTILIYKNLTDGIIREFEIDDPTWQNENEWEYVETKTTVISEGYTPPIKSLPIINSNGQDISQEILGYDGKIMLVIVNDFESIDLQSVELVASGMVDRVVILTSAQIPTNTSFEIYNSDYSVMNTMIQNIRGGALLLEKGTITRKMTMCELM